MAKDKEHSHAAHHGEHITDLPDVSYIKNIDVTHEASDVSVEGILKFVVGLTLMTAAVCVLMWALFKLLDSQVVEKNVQAQPGPMAMTEKERLPPEPRLQSAPGFGVKLESGETVNLELSAPQSEYWALKAQWEQVLANGKKDQSGQQVAIPIDEAMKRLAADQKLMRGEVKSSSEWSQYEAHSATAASSGRVVKK